MKSGSAVLPVEHSKKSVGRGKRERAEERTAKIRERKEKRGKSRECRMG